MRGSPRRKREKATKTARSPAERRKKKGRSRPYEARARDSHSITEIASKAQGPRMAACARTVPREAQVTN